MRCRKIGTCQYQQLCFKLCHALSKTESFTCSYSPGIRDAVASPSGSLKITTTFSDGKTTDDTPTIQGKAPPGSTVTITIHSSNPQTVVVTADANGNWVYTTTPPLESGTHVHRFRYRSNNGKTTDLNIDICRRIRANETATQSAMPISGDISTTYIILILGSLLLLRHSSSDDYTRIWQIFLKIILLQKATQIVSMVALIFFSTAFLFSLPTKTVTLVSRAGGTPAAIVVNYKKQYSNRSNRFLSMHFSQGEEESTICSHRLFRALKH